MFDFNNHKEEKFLVGGYKSSGSQLEWMKNGTENVVRYNIPFNSATKTCYTSKPQYLLLYSYQSQGGQALRLYMIDSISRCTKEQLEAEGYKTPKHDEYVIFSLKEEISIAKLQLLPLWGYANYKKRNLSWFHPFVLSGKEVIQSLEPKRYYFIDLFAGLGGIRMGFEQALQEKGVLGECVFTSEIKPHALKAYNENFPGKEIVAQDVTKITKENLPSFNVLLGGFPCQAFSSAGAGKGFADTRGTMFFEVQRILKDHLSTVDGFVLENVEGLVTHDMRENELFFDGDIPIGRTLATILHILRNELKFNVSWAVLNAADFGVPQNRKRIYIVGCKKRFGTVNLTFPSVAQPVGTGSILEKGLPCIDNSFSRLLLSHYKPEQLVGKALKDKRGGDSNIHSWDIEKKGHVSDEEKELLNILLHERRKRNWAQIIGIDWMDGMPLTEQQISTFFHHEKLHEMLEKLTQQGYLVYEHPKKKIWHVDDAGNRWSSRTPDETKPKGYNIVTGKLSFEISSILNPQEPVNTLVAMDMNTVGVIDGDGIRHLTLREGLRLFGYPEKYSLESFNDKGKGVDLAYDLIGNSVCVPVIKAISERLIDTLKIVK